MSDVATLFEIVICVIAHGCFSLSSVHIENLNACGKCEIAVNMFRADKTYLSVGSIKLVQVLHGKSDPVSESVTEEIIEYDVPCTCRYNRYLRRSVE